MCLIWNKDAKKNMNKNKNNYLNNYLKDKRKNSLFWERFSQGTIKTYVSSVKIRTPSPKEILSWTERPSPNSTLVGKVINAHTVEHDTLRPITGGLFCERIFGPIATNVCACLRRKSWKEIYCKECQIEFTQSRLRRYRMGHILLAAPVIHIWAMEGGHLANILGKKNLIIKSIAYGEVMCQSKLLNNVNNSTNFFNDHVKNLKILKAPLKSKILIPLARKLKKKHLKKPIDLQVSKGAQAVFFHLHHKNYRINFYSQIFPTIDTLLLEDKTKPLISKETFIDTKPIFSYQKIPKVSTFVANKGSTNPLTYEDVLNKQQTYHRENVLPFQRFILYQADTFIDITRFFNSLGKELITFPLPHYSKQKFIFRLSYLNDTKNKISYKSEEKMSYIPSLCLKPLVMQTSLLLDLKISLKSKILTPSANSKLLAKSSNNINLDMFALQSFKKSSDFLDNKKNVFINNKGCEFIGNSDFLGTNKRNPYLSFFMNSNSMALSSGLKDKLDNAVKRGKFTDKGKSKDMVLPWFFKINLKGNKPSIRLCSTLLKKVVKSSFLSQRKMFESKQMPMFLTKTRAESKYSKFINLHPFSKGIPPLLHNPKSMEGNINGFKFDKNKNWKQTTYKLEQKQGTFLPIAQQPSTFSSAKYFKEFKPIDQNNTVRDLGVFNQYDFLNWGFYKPQLNVSNSKILWRCWPLLSSDSYFSHESKPFVLSLIPNQHKKLMNFCSPLPKVNSFANYNYSPSVIDTKEKILIKSKKSQKQKCINKVANFSKTRHPFACYKQTLQNKNSSLISLKSKILTPSAKKKILTTSGKTAPSQFLSKFSSYYLSLIKLQKILSPNFVSFNYSKRFSNYVWLNFANLPNKDLLSQFYCEKAKVQTNLPTFIFQPPSFVPFRTQQNNLNFNKDITLRNEKNINQKINNVKNLAYTGSSVIFQTLQSLNLILLDYLINWKWNKAFLNLHDYLLLMEPFIEEDILSDRKHKRRCARFKILLSRRKNLIQSFLRTKQLPEWMVLYILPVLPPALRPILELEENHVIVSDVNILYQTVIRRNEALVGLLTYRVLEVDILAKQVSLQQSVEKLFDKGAGTQARPVKALSQGFHGKRGLFRSHLLGKRVDYSGRSVIVVGPQLKIYECGIPKEMALILFLPFLIARLKKYKMASTTSQAKLLIFKKDKRIWSHLKSLIYEHPVLLNRAPTLHRLGFQAFQPILVSGKALILPALVCTGFNADFDGDQMGVHVPISYQARAESWKLLYAKNNMLSPATGKPIIILSQEMILGCYCATLVFNHTFSKQLLVNKVKNLHTTKNLLNFNNKLLRINTKYTSLSHYSTKDVLTKDATLGLPTPETLTTIPSLSSSLFSDLKASISKDILPVLVERLDSKQERRKNQMSRNLISKDFNMMIKKKKNNYFTTFQEIYKALNEFGSINMQTPVWLRMSFFEDNQFLEQPLEIRLDAMGCFSRFYCQSQRYFTKNIKSQDQVKGTSYIRTTAGRIQLNEIFYSSWS